MNRSEQETVIVFNAEDETAMVETFFGPTITQMRRLGVTPRIVHYQKSDGRIIGLSADNPAPEGSRIVGGLYELPKGWVRFHRPRELSEEQKARARARLQRLQERQSLSSDAISRGSRGTSKGE